MGKKIVLSVLIVPMIIIEIFLFNLLFTEPIYANQDTNFFYNFDRKLYDGKNLKNVPDSFIRWEINENINSFYWFEILNFYTEYTKNEDVTNAIIEAALKNNVPLNLSFALAWKESKFNPKAYNHNYGSSYDRGLYQLNNTWRIGWTKDDFYDISLNSYEGNSYLAYCLELSNNDVEQALYGYNAGPDAILNGNIPQHSIQYAEDVLEYEDFLNVEFNKAFERKNK